MHRYWSLFLSEANYTTVRYTDIDVRRTENDGHGIWDLTAFNTDGIDVSGTCTRIHCPDILYKCKCAHTSSPGANVHVHDCNIWNQVDGLVVDCK